MEARVLLAAHHRCLFSVLVSQVRYLGQMEYQAQIAPGHVASTMFEMGVVTRPETIY